MKREKPSPAPPPELFQIRSEELSERCRLAAVQVCNLFGMTYPLVGFLGSKHWHDIERTIRDEILALSEAISPGTVAGQVQSEFQEEERS